MAVAQRIVIVDDDPSVRLLIARVLQKAGYEVASFSNGEDALTHLQGATTDLLVTDRLLPRMSGMDLIHKVRQLAPSLPVVLITGAPEHHSVSQERVEVYLGKPFKSLTALEEAVARALEMGKTLKQRQEAQTRLAEVMAQLKSPGSSR